MHSLFQEEYVHYTDEEAVAREGKGWPDGTQPIVKSPGSEAGLPLLGLAPLLTAVTDGPPVRLIPSLSVEGREAQVQNTESFPNVNILALTNLFENTFLQNNLFLNS